MINLWVAFVVGFLAGNIFMGLIVVITLAITDTYKPINPFRYAFSKNRR